METALEEDAPGLLQVRHIFYSRIIYTLKYDFISFILQVLVDKGVLIDEMKLYGQTEIDEAIDESLTEFSDLEAVISKVLMLIWFDTFLVLCLSLSEQTVSQAPSPLRSEKTSSKLKTSPARPSLF